MRISFSGKESIGANIADSERLISDIERLSSCIPDSRDFKMVNEREFSINVDVGIGNLRGTFLIHGICEVDGSDLVRYKLNGGGFGNRVGIELVVRLDGNSETTNLSWNADLDISGLISGLGQSIVRKVSEEKIAEIMRNVRSVLERDPER